MVGVSTPIKSARLCKKIEINHKVNWKIHLLYVFPWAAILSNATEEIFFSLRKFFGWPNHCNCQFLLLFSSPMSLWTRHFSYLYCIRSIAFHIKRNSETHRDWTHVLQSKMSISFVIIQGPFGESLCFWSKWTQWIGDKNEIKMMGLDCKNKETNRSCFNPMWLFEFLFVPTTWNHEAQWDLQEMGSIAW